MGIKIGNIDASYFKVGSGDCSIYLGDAKLYPTAQPSYKLQATYSDSSKYNLACDSSTMLTRNEVRSGSTPYSAMTTAVIGDCVTIIGSQAFRYCSGLTSIEIPSSVTDIGLWGFESCSSLINITINATTPPTMGGSTFNNTNNCPIYVPCESVDAYKSASGWSTYASRIQGIQPCKQWVSYYEGDSVPNYGVYGIKFQSSASYEYVETPAYIGFIDGNNNYINIYYDNGTWYIETASGAEEITFDEETDYATIIFDDYGVGAATIDEMALLSTGMPFDMELYELN